jgi:hypothetical protein
VDCTVGPFCKLGPWPVRSAPKKAWPINIPRILYMGPYRPNMNEIWFIKMCQRHTLFMHNKSNSHGAWALPRSCWQVLLQFLTRFLLLRSIALPVLLLSIYGGACCTISTADVKTNQGSFFGLFFVSLTNNSTKSSSSFCLPPLCGRQRK